MDKIISVIFLLSVAYSPSGPASAETVDARNYFQAHGWKPFDTASLPRSPMPDVVPLIFYDKGNSVPSCGLLTATTGGKGPVFIDLVGAAKGVGFPQCLGMTAMTQFRLQNKEYMVVEYLSRETREDVDRHFHFLVRKAEQGFVTDEILTEAVPVVSVVPGVAVKAMDGVRFARIFQLGRAQPAWRLIDRDFISDKSSSFATFEDKTVPRCQFVTEAGAAPVVTSSDVFLPSSKCDSVLASSRFDKGGNTYYLAMFRTQDRKQMVGVTSVRGDGHIEVEKTLAESINRAGMTTDIKTAKAAIIKEIR